MALDLHARDFHLLNILTVECRIRSAGWFASCTVNEKAIVNDRWTSNGQHVLHTAMHKTYTSRAARTRKKTPRCAFCLNEKNRAECVTEECMYNICTSFDISNKTFETDICRKARASFLSILVSHEMHPKDAPRNLKHKLLSLVLLPSFF